MRDAGKIPAMRSTIALLFLLAGFAAAKDIDIPTPRGAKLKSTIHLPKTANGTGVVIAPGGGYHKDRPLIVAAATHLQKAGFVVVRFNWNYFTQKQKPSAELKNELKDLDAAIAYLRKRADVKQILVAGKSLGSLVTTLRAATKADDIEGIALLTFPIHAPNNPAQAWKEAAELAKVDLPTLIVCGNNDKLCDLKTLYKFVAKLPKGTQTHVGDRGVVFSGGQRQRLAIARALLRRPRILILDEATSAIDSEGEGIIKEGLRKLPDHPTIIIVAHRLSTVVDVDRVIVVENGGIANTEAWTQRSIC